MNKILVVDDESKITDVIKSFLESKGYEVDTAESGTQAYQKMAQTQYALLILDLMLPDTTGEDICVTVRKKSRVPIIMLTAKVEEEDQLTGLNIGADDYITKPFSLKTLHARVEAVLRRAGEDAVPLFSNVEFNDKDLVIDFTSHEVTKQGAAVPLTPNEFKLLSAMIKYPTKVFTREELMDITFGMDYIAQDRTIDSHIKNLRRKIETDPKKPEYVLTVHGVGYRFGGT